MAALCRQSMDLGLTENFDEIVFLASREPVIEDLLIRAGYLLAQALLGAVNLFDVDAVVIGGHHFQQVSKWLLPPVENAMGELTMRHEVRPVSVKYSTLGEAAGAVGAASVVFDKLLPASQPITANFIHSREAVNVGH